MWGGFDWVGISDPHVIVGTGRQGGSTSHVAPALTSGVSVVLDSFSCYVTSHPPGPLQVAWICHKMLVTLFMWYLAFKHCKAKVVRIVHDCDAVIFVVFYWSNQLQ